MSRVAIIGNAGGGKTTLAFKLGRALGLPVHPIDKIQWRANWQPAPPREIKRRHDEILSGDRWIIDGWGAWELITERFEAADTIILVDYPLYIHYWWSFKRQLKSVFVPRNDMPENCPMLPKTLELARLMWLVHHQMRPRLKALVAGFSGEKRVIELRSPRELRRFELEYC
jgi:adenylate kinase family enzyme